MYIAQSTSAHIEPGSDQHVLRVYVGYSKDFVPDDDVVLSLAAQRYRRTEVWTGRVGISEKQEKQALEAVAATAAVGGVIANAAAISNIQSMAIVGSLSCLPSRVRKQSDVVSWIISPLFYVAGPFPGAGLKEDNIVAWNVVMLLGIFVTHFIIT
eukprot:PhM_4_TR3068/c1_g4_i1/m.49729